ncbi:MAG: hypothetical protein R2684_15865 [Pyrinomonadaceae bacterium]
MKGGGGDWIEVLAYFIGFWWFVFSSDFRRKWLQEFRDESLLGKILSLGQAAISIAFGVLLPVFLIYMIVGKG